MMDELDKARRAALPADVLEAMEQDARYLLHRTFADCRDVSSSR